MSPIKSRAIYGVINGRLRVARVGGAGGVVGGAAPGSARVMGAITGAPGVLREDGPALTQYGGGRVAGAPTTSGVFLYTLVTVSTVRFLCCYFQATAGPATSRYVEWVGSLVFQSRLIHRDFWGTCLPPPWHSELFDFVAKLFLVLKLHSEVYNLTFFEAHPPLPVFFSW